MERAAGQAFAEESLRRGDFRALVTAKERLRHFAWAGKLTAAIEKIVRKLAERPLLKLQRQHDAEMHDLLDEFREAFQEATAATDAKLADRDFQPPGNDIDAWMRLARVVERDPKGLSLGDIYEWAIAWSERKDIEAEKIAKAQRANSANIPKLFPRGEPANPQVRELAIRLQNQLGPGRTMIGIARELTDESPGDDSQAKSLLSELRRQRKRGNIVL